MRRTTARLLTAAVSAALALCWVAPAHADGVQESDFAARVNALRTSRGLSPLTVDAGISTTARNWASRVAANGAMSHNPNLANELPPGWTDEGENVAFGPDVATMERELENDPPHLANLLNSRFTHLGVGVVEVNGRLWGVQDFAGFGGGPPASSPYAASPYAASPYAQSPYAPSPYAQAPPTTPQSVTPAPAPAVTTATTPPPPITAAAASSPTPVAPPAPASAAPAASSSPAAPRAGAVAFTGRSVERHLTLAAAAVAIGMVLLTLGGLAELRRSARVR